MTLTAKNTSPTIARPSKGLTPLKNPIVDGFIDKNENIVTINNEDIIKNNHINNNNNVDKNENKNVFVLDDEKYDENPISTTDAIKDYLSKNTKKKFSDTHVQDTYWIKKEKRDTIIKLTKKGGKGLKTRIIDEALDLWFAKHGIEIK